MAARKTKLTVDWIVTTTGHGSEAGADPTYLSEFPRKIFYWIKIHGQLININEVTDFYGGFSSGGPIQARVPIQAHPQFS